MNVIIILLTIAIIGFIIYVFVNNRIKQPHIGAVGMFDGAPKTGKSTLAIHTAIKECRKARFRVKIYNIFAKIFKRPLQEMPLLYSNIPIDVKYYVPLTKEILRRQKRVNYKSVIYIGEFSLVADSMTYKDVMLNEDIQLFAKLIGHETKGGKLIIDTQCIADCHYAIKRVIGQHFYIHKCYKLPLLPFIILKVREMTYSDDGSVVNTIATDLEDDLKTILIGKWVWKKFDCYCYSTFTDNKAIEQNIIKPKTLKAKNIVTFRDFKNKELNEKK